MRNSGIYGIFAAAGECERSDTSGKEAARGGSFGRRSPSARQFVQLLATFDLWTESPRTDRLRSPAESGSPNPRHGGTTREL